MEKETSADFGALGEEFVADPYPTYARLRQGCPVHRVRLADGGTSWIIVGYDEARAALADPELRLSYWPDSTPSQPTSQLLGPQLLDVDPPQHTRLRQLVNKSFTARRMEAMRPRIQRITDGLLDELTGAGGGDLVEDFAVPLPVRVICELLGVPSLAIGTFREWIRDITSATEDDPQRSAAAQREMAEYITAMIEDKRARQGSDLMSDLIRATDADHGRLTPDELRGMAFLLLFAGYETTATLIANGTLALLTHPEQLAALRADWGLLDSAIAEMLRWSGSLESAVPRFTRGPVRAGDVVIPGGAQAVVVSLASANRDERRFTRPEEFDIRRNPANHLAFGHGIHYCLGAPLGLLQARIALRSLLERCPDLALDASPAELRWRPGLLVRGVLNLPVRLKDPG